MSVRTVLMLLFRRIARIYFREIEVAGDVPARDVGGRLFGANHVNGLVDPILVLTQAPCAISPVAKSTLWKIPGLRWLLDVAGAVPIIRRRDVPGKSESDNEAVFARVATHLVGGGNILIFPEGTSHNEPHLLALKSGAGRMLARAHAEPRPREDAAPRALTFQAVALEFDERDVFRSRSLVLFGPVRHLDELPGADLAKEVTDTLFGDLSELLVEGASWEERVLLVRVAEMFANDADDRSLANMNRVGRQLEAARRVLASSSPDEVRAMEERLRAYGKLLEAEETTDDRVARVAHGRPFVDATPDRALRAAAMILTLPLALAAAVVYWLPYQLPRFVTKKLKGDPDVSSTYKLGVGLVVYPLWAAAGVALAFWRLPAPYAIVATVLLFVSPFTALAWLDRWDRLAARASMLAPTEQQRDRLADLAAERTELMSDLEVLRAHAEATRAAQDA
ncbi:MAG: 1-acyl-sn-glycerol-3-phosphate acyltransferase [Labilithrix sp.]|nr:1-acyl-sn-glycerol-3-phosphate acyltransferase [Labilithrix sp.]MCW5813549.1 1-acyl-sn-glycerol-3-phosphate acyltransferase [Labilithrix sp.]